MSRNYLKIIIVYIKDKPFYLLKENFMKFKFNKNNYNNKDLKYYKKHLNFISFFFQKSLIFLLLIFTEFFFFRILLILLI